MYLAVGAGTEKGLTIPIGNSKPGQQPAGEKCDTPDRLLYTLLHILIDEACRKMLNDYTPPSPGFNVDAKAGERIISIEEVLR
jgi:hypothetical protein